MTPKMTATAETLLHWRLPFMSAQRQSRRQPCRVELGPFALCPSEPQKLQALSQMINTRLQAPLHLTPPGSLQMHSQLPQKARKQGVHLERLPPTPGACTEMRSVDFQEGSGNTITSIQHRNAYAVPDASRGMMSSSPHVISGS